MAQREPPKSRLQIPGSNKLWVTDKKQARRLIETRPLMQTKSLHDFDPDDVPDRYEMDVLWPHK